MLLREYIETFVPLAKKAVQQIKSLYPESRLSYKMVITQWGWESKYPPGDSNGWANSYLARTHHNLGGIKYTERAGRLGATRGSSPPPPETGVYANYPSWDVFALDYAYVMTNGLYTRVLRAQTVEEQLTALMGSAYAEGGYPAIISFYRQYFGNLPDDVPSGPVQPAPTPEPIPSPSPSPSPEPEPKPEPQPEPEPVPAPSPPADGGPIPGAEGIGQTQIIGWLVAAVLAVMAWLFGLLK